jgi:hypothetical protein
MAGITINPIITSNAAGSFSASSDGVVAGTYYADPSVRFLLSQGTIGATTGVMYGGMAISEIIPAASVIPGQSPFNILPSTSVATIQGWSVFDQAHALINTPESTVPTGFYGMSISYFRTGSNARIAVACAPSLVSLDGGLITQQVSWDYVGQQIVPYVAAYAANVITAATWAATNGGQSTFTTTTAHGVAVGDYFYISGMTPAGYNGGYIAQTGTTGSTLVGIATPTQQAVTPGTATAFGTLVAGGGAAPCRVLSIIPTNNMTVGIDSSGTYFNWNYNGSAAVILI